MEFPPLRLWDSLVGGFLVSGFCVSGKKWWACNMWLMNLSDHT